MVVMNFLFFFQAEDGIRDRNVTGVQTCALPITLIADDMVWELAYAPAIGHPARLSGRDDIIRHVTWFLSAVENFRFIEPRISAFADPLAAVVQVKAEALIKPTGRVYRQEYVMFLIAKDGKIAHIREYFDPTRAAKSMNESILDLNRGFDRRSCRQISTHCS